MVARAIELAQDEDEYLDTVVADGVYPNADIAISDALRALRDRREDEWLASSAARAAIQVGIDQIERGETVAVEDLWAYVDRLNAVSA